MILICFSLIAFSFIAKVKVKKKDNCVLFFSNSYYPSLKEFWNKDSLKNKV